MTRTARKEIKTVGKLDTLTSNKDSVQTTIQYLDGLGRPVQTVQRYGSPTGKDIVQGQAYDQFGREPVKYLPYTVAASSAGMYQPTAISGSGGVTGSAMYSFYQQTGQGYVNTTAPFAVTGFELSPLNRVVEQGAPGTAGQLPGTGDAGSSGHTMRMVYTNNDQSSTFSSSTTSNNPGSRIAALYKAVANSDGSRTLSRASNSATYAANQLSVTISRDENWQPGQGCLGTTEEYKDKQGRVVLKRTYNLNGSTAEMLSTYYVYDDKGQLAFVLPPGINPDATGSAFTADQLNAFAYMYRYDHRGRLIFKKVPGKDWDYLIYNKLDQLAYTQDGTQRLLHQWSWIKYDALGRVIITGVENNTYNTPDNMNAYFDGVTGLQWETRTNSRPEGYTLNTHPMAYNENGNIKVMTINFYDDYTAPGLPSAYATTPTGATTTMTKGLLTATKTAILKSDGTISDDYLWAVFYYDNEGRLIQTYKQHYQGATFNTGNYDEITSTYNFNDEVIGTMRHHYVAGSSTAAVTIGNSYTYDHAGRKRQTYQATYPGTSSVSGTQISQLNYNELGQLLTKNLGDNIQTVTYAYNERGWLTTANTNSNLFNMELRYNNPVAGTAQYNGNISNMIYTTTHGAGYNMFTYVYDKLNRLTNAGNGGTLDESIVYDKMGNITALTRTGAGAATLAYTYEGSNQSNRLATVSNSGSAYRSYVYDNNGNATSDGAVSGSKTISYNMFNLPATVGSVATYTYDAKGQKVRNTGSDGTFDYVDGIVYKNGDIAFIATEEGRAVNNSGAYKYEYNLKDHLGNTRVSFYNNSGTPTVIQEDEYYSFGLRKGLYDNASNNRYLYNGKEIQTDLANQYDYGARFYDPVIARWTSVDPLAEKYHGYSPYNYVMNNPINSIDPDGRFVFLIPLAIWAVESGAVYFASAAIVATVVVHNASQNGAFRSRSSSSGTDFYTPSAKSQPAPSVLKPHIVKNEAGDKKDKSGDKSGKDKKERTKDDPLPRDKHGDPVTDEEGKGVPHTQLGTQQGRKGSYTQGREFDENGKPVKDVDHTDHGRPQNHTNPHEHDYIPNPTGGTPQRGPAKPLTNQ